MIPKEFDAITKTDVDALVANAVAEGRTIEYKQQLPGGGDDDKREFLADVSSLANASGGDLIYGVTEKRDANGKPTGTAEKAEGLAGVNADAEIRRLDESIRSGIDPRLPGIRIRAVDGFSAGPVILVRIPKSWAGPHMVTFKSLSRFYSRTSAGKYQLDVREIRSAFSASGDLRAKINAFRTERLGKIIANEGPISLPEAPKVILHLIPLSILDPSAQLNLAPLFQNHASVPPLRPTGQSCRFNLDGIVTYSQPIEGKPAYTYLQVFRSGIFEATAAHLLIQRGDQFLIPGFGLEQYILKGVATYLSAAKQIGVPLPLVVLLTLHGVKGYRMFYDHNWYSYDEAHPIDRETLLLPEVLLEDYTVSPDILLKPAFDALWQAGGIAGSRNYNDQGRWIGKA